MYSGRMISTKLPTEGLTNHGYHPCEITPVLYKYDTIPVTFLLTADDFGVKYLGKEHVTHLFDALQQY